MRRFEFAEGTSNKFWEIEVSGNTHTVRFGKTGTNGQSSTKAFASAAEAEKDAASLIASKVKKGYAEVAAAAKPVAAATALEAAIHANPDDAEAWAVYADWLLEQDDVRGQLVQAQLRGEGGDALLAKHAKALWGRFAPEGDLAECAEITWKNGHWWTAKIKFNPYEMGDVPEEIKGFAAVAGHLLRHPSARFLYDLRLGANEGIEDGDMNFDAAIAAVVKAGVRPSLRRIVVGDFDSEECEISWSSVGDVSPLFAVLPNLEHMVVHGGRIEIENPVHPRLKHLELQTGGLPAQPVQALAKSSFPALETLLIWLGTDNYGAEATAEQVAAMLSSAARFPKLHTLGLMNSDLSNAFPALLAASPLLPQLRRVDFSMGTMTADGARELLAHAARYRHLEHIDLDRNAIEGPELLAALQSALPMLNVGTQEPADGDYGPYVSVGE